MEVLCLKNYYKVLGIEKNATNDEIKRAYAKMIRKFPPEKDGEKFGEIGEAYDLLSNKEKRKEYDEENGYDDISQELLDDAIECIKNNNYETSIINLKKFILLNPENVVAKRYLSLCSYKVEDFNGVYENTKYLIENGEEIEEGYFDNFITAAIKLNKFLEAEEYINKLIEKNHSIHSYIKLCELYYNKKTKGTKKLREVLINIINPRLPNEKLNLNEYRDLSLYAASIDEVKWLESYLRGFISTIKYNDIEKSVKTLLEYGDTFLGALEVNISSKYVRATIEVLEKYSSIKESSLKVLSKLKSTERLLKSISTIINNMEICYEVKTYIVNVVRQDFNIGEEHINTLKKEEDYIIERLNEVVINNPKSLKNSIVKIRKNDLIYFKVMSTFDKYYRIATLNSKEEEDNNNNEIKAEVVKGIEESKDICNMDHNKKDSRLVNIFRKFL